MNSLCFILSVALCLSFGAHANFPDNPKPCKYGDIKCLSKAFEYFLKEKNQGDSSINLLKIDPLEIKEISIKQSGSSSVKIDLTFENIMAYGLSKAKIRKLKGFGKDMTQRHEIVLRIDQLDLVSDYNVKGKILLLPVTGKDKSNLTMTNMIVTMKFSGIPLEKDGATYMKVDKVFLDADPERLIYKFDNLFNGDKVLSDNMNLFLNENWAEIFKEVKEPICDAFGKILQSIIGRVFTKYPYDKFFVE